MSHPFLLFNLRNSFHIPFPGLGAKPWVSEEMWVFVTPAKEVTQCSFGLDQHEAGNYKECEFGYVPTLVQ